MKFIKIRYSDFEIYKNHYTASGGRASTLIFIKIKNIADFYKNHIENVDFYKNLYTCSAAGATTRIFINFTVIFIWVWVWVC